MKLMRSNLYSFLRPVRLFVATIVCSLLLFTQALPAFSVSLPDGNPVAPKSDIRSGEANLTQIEKKSQEAVLSDPYSLRKEQKETNPGLNADQGSADKEKMSTPENSQDAVSIEQRVKEGLEKITK